jgi:hypothetical protein
LCLWWICPCHQNMSHKDDHARTKCAIPQNTKKINNHAAATSQYTMIQSGARASATPLTNKSSTHDTLTHRNASPRAAAPASRIWLPPHKRRPRINVFNVELCLWMCPRRRKTPKKGMINQTQRAPLNQQSHTWKSREAAPHFKMINEETAR